MIVALAVLNPDRNHYSVCKARFTKIIAIVLCLASLCCVHVVLAPSAWAQDSKPVRLVGFDYPPFYQDEDGVLDGIAVELGKQLFARLEMQMSLSVFPLKRSLEMLENGEADATLILIKTPERSKYLLFSNAVMTVRGLIWSASGLRERAVHFDRLEDLRRYKIGVTRGYSYGPKFDELLKSMHVDVANSDYLNYVKLVAGRIEIFPGNEIVAAGLFKKHPELRGKVVHSDKSFIEWVLRIAVSKKSKLVDMMPQINEELGKMKVEGVIDAIIRKYTE
ncbi:transporter substrate-binding domain-containing protein [Pseudodesulfovibrio sp. zrk46]|uniref:substrate-binding periplasmic protein n=1 Tax=Pseudodesulfovibrio sp. zrk46 TaxID=2725288 RepID=UPI0014494AC4|nr:transporter substrate-binding domain-containing protein [Pseudodesulfovibrio sp. zrk46]QJB56425.1 amino acid ABC transporter substrate-binding protein [Pseudodesulfovibrio sp. zrk46]